MTATNTLARHLAHEARRMAPAEAIALLRHARQLESRKHFSTIPNDKGTFS